MTQAKMPEPLFWFRPRSDGGYEGPLHDAIIGEVRKQSGAWIPFFSASQMEAYAAAKAQEALEAAAAICDADALEYQKHVDSGAGRAAALRCLCVAEGLGDAIRGLIPTDPAPSRRDTSQGVLAAPSTPSKTATQR